MLLSSDYMYLRCLCIGELPNGSFLLCENESRLRQMVWGRYQSTTWVWVRKFRLRTRVAPKIKMSFLGKIKAVVRGNPVTREYEIGRHIASAGPGLLWKVHSGLKKSTKQVYRAKNWQEESVARKQTLTQI